MLLKKNKPFEFQIWGFSLSNLINSKILQAKFYGDREEISEFYSALLEQINS